MKREIQQSLRHDMLSVIREAEAAKMLNLSRRTLQRLRLEGGGPRYLKLTNSLVGYTAADLHAWIEGRFATSTSSGRPR